MNGIPRYVLFGTLGTILTAILGVFLVGRNINGSDPLESQPASKAPFVSVAGTDSRVAESYGKLPLSFEANTGQSDSQVKFLSRGQGYSLFLTGSEAVLALQSSEPTPAIAGWHEGGSTGPQAVRRSYGKRTTLRMALIDANPDAKVTGLHQLPGKSNYFIGNDPKKWRTQVPTYAKVNYENVYPGVDLVYYGNQRRLEYDFVVAPGADPNAITLDLASDSGRAALARIDADGNLVVAAGDANVLFNKPVVYQPDSTGAPAGRSDKHFLDGRFVLAGDRRVRFAVGAYDHSKPLIIDPVLTYSTFHGAGNADAGLSVAVDGSGVYVTGYTYSTHFPTTTGAYQTDYNNFGDVFVSKFSLDGTALLYSTYIGGGTFESGNGIAVDGSGNATITGYTGDASEITNALPFPTTSHAYQTLYGGGRLDAFVAKLSDDGSKLLYSTFLGGSDEDSGNGIALDSAGNVYVTGTTASNVGFAPLHAAQNAYAGREDAFLVKLDLTQSDDAALLYSTYLGGLNKDEGLGIAVDGSGIAYVTGFTESMDFPQSLDALQGTLGGSPDAFVAKIDPGQSGADSLLYSSYLGGGGDDQGFGIAVDGSGGAFVTGSTKSNDFPVSPTAFHGSLKGAIDAFVTKLDLSPGSSPTLAYSTYLGSGFAGGTGIAVDDRGKAYVTGSVYFDLPLTPNAYQSNFGGGGDDAFLAILSPDGSHLLYSTFFGGADDDTGKAIALDGTRDIYVTGFTISTDFPTLNALQGTYGGSPVDAFLARFDPFPDFSLSPMAAITASVGGSGTSSQIVGSIDEFASPVDLTVSTVDGFTSSFSPTPVTPPADGSAAASTLTVALGPSVTAGTYSLTATGTSGTLSHSTPVSVNVTVTSGGTGTVITVLQAAGCIDNAGVSNALLTKLAAAQADIDAGKIQTAINTLTALLNQLNAQAGKHIGTSCTVNGVPFNPVDVLINDVKALLASLGVTFKANPILGNVLNASKLGMGNITVNIMSSTKTIAASAVTDVTGFYYFPSTANLVSGANYTIKVVVPKGFKGSTPASLSFTWRATALSLGNFVIN